MPLNITVNLTGSPSEDDVRAALMIVEQENARRAAADPVEDPLPVSPVPQLANAYQGLLAQIIEKAHASYVAQEAERSLRDETADLWRRASQAQRAAARAALGG